MVDDGWVDGCMDVWMYGWIMDVCMMDGWMDDGWMMDDVCMYGLMDVCWMDDGSWMDGWMDGWMLDG